VSDAFTSKDLAPPVRNTFGDAYHGGPASASTVGLPCLSSTKFLFWSCLKWASASRRPGITDVCCSVTTAPAGVPSLV
jgi:hypothetical protein